MRKNTHRFTASLLAALIVLSCFALSCGESDEGEPSGGNQAPELPPVSSFVMDLSSMTGQEQGLQTNQNFLWASTNLLVWNSVIVLTMAVPVASFVEAANHEAELQPDGSWVWSYSFTILEQTYQARLVARFKWEGVSWEMYITKQGEYEDFKWYTGTCDYTLTSGTWDLFLEPSNPVPFIDIEWHADPAEETGDLKYTNVIPESPGNGDYIFGELTNLTPYDALYDVYYKSADNLLEIEWNSTTLEGRVRDPGHFGDTNWHCWDAEHEDIVCP